MDNSQTQVLSIEEVEFSKDFFSSPILKMIAEYNRTEAEFVAEIDEVFLCEIAMLDWAGSWR